jgi:hypothetical protein
MQMHRVNRCCVFFTTNWKKFVGDQLLLLPLNYAQWKLKWKSIKSTVMMKII